MFQTLLDSVRSVLTYDVGRSIKTVVFFDVNRVLRWDVGRALRQPIPPRLLMAAVVLWLAVVGLNSLLAQSDTRPFTRGRSSCTPYDPAGLILVENPQTGTWQLRRGDGAILKGFADRDDAAEGIAVAKQHSRLCYIGKDNARPDKQNYMMEYWK